MTRARKPLLLRPFRDLAGRGLTRKRSSTLRFRAGTVALYVMIGTGTRVYACSGRFTVTYSTPAIAARAVPPLVQTPFDARYVSSRLSCPRFCTPTLALEAIRARPDFARFDRCKTFVRVRQDHQIFLRSLLLGDPQ
jgi:hypothetical protein